MKDKCFIDTNIFLYAFCTKDLQKQTRAKQIVLDDATISVQVINESSSNLIKKLKFDEEKIEWFVESVYRRYEITGFSKKLFLLGVMIRKKYQYSYYDSLIISAALLSKCSILYSEDMQHGQLIENTLTIINPFQEKI